MKRVIRVWLKSEFQGGRHQRRLDKVVAFENNGQCIEQSHSESREETPQQA